MLQRITDVSELPIADTRGIFFNRIAKISGACPRAG